MNGSAFSWLAGSAPPGMHADSVKRIDLPKGPTDLTPVTGDFRGALAAIDNDALAPAFLPQVTIARNDGGAADLSLVGMPVISQDASRVTVWLAEGTAGYEYLVSITVQSQDGQQITRSFVIPVNLR